MKSVAPDFMALTTELGDDAPDIMITGTSAYCARISSSASMPSLRGIITSSSTAPTCPCNVRSRRSASSPSCASSTEYPWQRSAICR